MIQLQTFYMLVVPFGNACKPPAMLTPPPAAAPAAEAAIRVNSGFSISDSKAQGDCLNADLKAEPKPYTLAYWHHPRFSSGYDGSAVRLQPPGGDAWRGFGGKVIRNSIYQIEGRAGVAKLTLDKAEYHSAFIETNGRVWDPSGGTCH